MKILIAILTAGILYAMLWNNHQTRKFEICVNGGKQYIKGDCLPVSECPQIKKEKIQKDFRPSPQTTSPRIRLNAAPQNNTWYVK